MKKIVYVIALAVLLLPMLALAQNATDTTSAIKTGVWEGSWTQNGGYHSVIKLNVASITDKHVKAQLNFVNRNNSIVELTGIVADSFGDFVEQSRWQFVASDKKFKDGTWIKFTDVKLIQGDVEIKSTYFVFLKDNTITGCWFHADEPQPSGRIELKAPEQ